MLLNFYADPKPFEGKRPPLKYVLQAVSITTGIPAQLITSQTRFRHLVRARMLFYYVARFTGRSTPQIGKACGDRDHSTVLHGINKVEKNKAAFEPELSKLLAAFEQKDSDNV